MSVCSVNEGKVSGEKKQKENTLKLTSLNLKLD